MILDIFTSLFNDKQQNTQAEEKENIFNKNHHNEQNQHNKNFNSGSDDKPKKRLIEDDDEYQLRSYLEDYKKDDERIFKKYTNGGKQKKGIFGVIWTWLNGKEIDGKGGIWIANYISNMKLDMLYQAHKKAEDLGKSFEEKSIKTVKEIEQKAKENNTFSTQFKNVLDRQAELQKNQQKNKSQGLTL